MTTQTENKFVDEKMPITKKPTVPTQTNMHSDLMTVEQMKKILAENEQRLAEIKRQQQLIENEFVYFEKCPVRYLKTKDENGNEIGGYKYKDGLTTPEEHFNTLNKLTATQDILLHTNITDSAALAQPINQKVDVSINIVNQVLADYEPRDSLEAKLCLQAHTLYTKGMQYLSLAANQNMIPQSEYFMKNAIKLMRLHNETVEALSRYRRGGTQNVVVQHVQVNDGGKAVVGGVFEGGGGQQKNCEVIP